MTRTRYRMLVLVALFAVCLGLSAGGSVIADGWTWDDGIWLALFGL